MRIAIFTDSFLPHISGVCTAVINQANELSRRGHDVLIFRAKGFGKNSKKRIKRNTELSADIRDVPISLPSFRHPGLRIAVPTVVSSLPTLRKFKPDIVHVHTEWGCGWEGVMCSKMMNLPLAGTFHTFFAEPEYIKQLHLPNLNMTKEMLWRYSVFFYNQCDTLFSPSHSIANQLIDKGLQVQPHFMSNGIPLPAFVEEDKLEALRREVGLTGPALVYCGRLSEEKSLDVLLDAMALVGKKRPDIQLLVIGDGHEREVLEAQVDKLSLRTSVLFTGRIDHQNLIERNYLRLAKAFITPSKTENQPVSILEAMSFALPILGADAKGIPELIEHEVNGLLFEPDSPTACADAIVTFMSDTSSHTAYAREARLFAEIHAISAVGERLESLYVETINEHEEKPPKRRLRRLGGTKKRKTASSID